MTTITTPDELKGYLLTTVNFENIASLDGQQFGNADQPYAGIFRSWREMRHIPCAIRGVGALSRVRQPALFLWKNKPT
jgi:hypothetical protein